jgi:hypothetical protein
MKSRTGAKKRFGGNVKRVMSGKLVLTTGHRLDENVHIATAKRKKSIGLGKTQPTTGTPLEKTQYLAREWMRIH